MNPDAILYVSSVIIGVAIPAAFYAGTRAGHSTADASIDWLRAELNEANDRLFAVSREPGVSIPPRAVEPDVVPELPDELAAIVADWENPSVQEQLRAQFGAMLAEGLSVAEVKRRHLES